MERNPFEPPTTPLANPTGLAVSPIRRSRWSLLRWLPIVYCGFFAFFCLVECGFELLKLSDLLAGRYWLQTVREMNPYYSTLAVVGWLGLMALGVRTLLCWYQCRWRSALWLTLIFFFLFSYGLAYHVSSP